MKLALILAALSLPETSSAEDAVKEIEARKVKHDALNDRVVILESSAEAAKKAVPELDAWRTRAKNYVGDKAEGLSKDGHVEASKFFEHLTAGEIDGKLEELKSKGLLAPGSKVEEALRKTAARDCATFDAQVAEMLELGVKVTPVGAKNQTGGKPPKRDTTDEVLAANPVLAGYLRAAGLSKEEVERYAIPKFLERSAEQG